MDDLSEKDYIEIASSFLLDSPPGEFNEVLTDVRALINNDTILNKCALTAFKTYNKSQMIPVKVPGSKHCAIIADVSETGPKSFADPRSGQSLEFDHIKQVFTGESSSYSGDASVESLRSSVQDALDQYLKEHFFKGHCACYGVDGKVIALITAHKYDPDNFWGGAWTSQWTISKSGKLEGSLKIRLHFFEDGNISMTADHKVKLTAGKKGDEIAAAIKKAECDWHSNLVKQYLTMDNTTFKSLRRRLPMEKTTLKWAGLLHHKIGQELAG